MIWCPAARYVGPAAARERISAGRPCGRS